MALHLQAEPDIPTASADTPLQALLPQDLKVCAMSGLLTMLQAGWHTGDGSSLTVTAASPASHAALAEALAVLGLEQVHCLLLHLHDGRRAC